MNDYSIVEIQKNKEMLDSEELHMFLIQQVESGEYETCLEALAEYVEKNDIDDELIKKMISPYLKGILYKEAIDRSLIRQRSKSLDIDTFF